MITNGLAKSPVTVGQRRPAAAMNLVQSSRLARQLAKLVIAGLLLAVAGMALLPWQQTSRGSGEVVAFVPQERQQTIESPIKGVVSQIAAGLVEGSTVRKGEFILEIQPLAANLVEQLESQLMDLKTKRESTENQAQAYRQQVEGFTEARDFAVSAGEQLVEAAREKLDSKQNLVTGYESREWQARANYERQKELFNSGIKSAREIEILKKEWDVSQAELNSVREEVLSLNRELAAKQAELEEKRQIAQTKIEYARAMEQNAIGSAATIQKEMRDLEIKLAELSRLQITAPRDGTIFRMPVYERGQTIQEGEAILTIVPDVGEMAVELFVPGNDMPLIQVGQEVRLQFEGWPAVQFPGWPSIAVGTFSGSVAMIDATDNGQGQFRVLVKPQEETQWPSERYLRQGVRVNGWVMLRQVALGYEIWRQLNGFPVLVAEKEPGPDKIKTPKLPK